ncbi:uncharacterized protein YfaQ (DUF2300 family) [Microvirga flocculans]|uniref:Uncharacterized protein YfaQ (DUF2300 family) n=1 Tax=Microvirga flocculans TaxID=217168 RepID=A0A7W6IBL2_9HYPH|nr:hypothetical protein [Microvirga flocculans]MBB4038420.1 uncharacterized protein YfaQ (DUF2300 family) [Microvirga flocculans]
MGALNAAVRQLETHDDVGQAWQLELFDLVPERVPGRERDIKVDPEDAANFRVQHDPRIIEAEQLRVAFGHDVLGAATHETRGPWRKLDDATQDMALVGAQSDLGERRPVPSADLLAEALEAVGQAPMDQIAARQHSLGEEGIIILGAVGWRPSLIPDMTSRSH